MSKTIKPDQLADEVMKELKKYEKLTFEDLYETAEEVSEETKKMLKSTSPVGKSKSHYKSKWNVKAERVGTRKFSFIIHNRGKGQLTHLLEHGHQLRQGGRADPVVHIKPAEDFAVKEYQKRVENKLK